MAQRIELLGAGGVVIKTIRADVAFCESAYLPGTWRVAAEQDADVPAPTAAEIILQTIVSMEREQLMSRINREFILGAMKREAIEAGYTEEQLEAKNKGYRLLKQFDMQIAALREQL